MSRKYKHDRVPTDVLADRLKELGKAVTKGRDEVERTFVMRIPAEPDHCPDLVLCESARRLIETQNNEKKLRTILALAYSGRARMYTDDGEFQDSTTKPFIDYKRDSVDEIQSKIFERGKKKLRDDAKSVFFNIGTANGKQRQS